WARVVAYTIVRARFTIRSWAAVESTMAQNTQWRINTVDTVENIQWDSIHNGPSTTPSISSLIPWVAQPS
ncbi:hypothetical protein FRC16_005728, partial [Serendipita sp. 398]